MYIYHINKSTDNTIYDVYTCCQQGKGNNRSTSRFILFTVQAGVYGENIIFKPQLKQTGIGYLFRVREHKHTLTIYCSTSNRIKNISIIYTLLKNLPDCTIQSHIDFLLPNHLIVCCPLQWPLYLPFPVAVTHQSVTSLPRCL